MHQKLFTSSFAVKLKTVIRIAIQCIVIIGIMSGYYLNKSIRKKITNKSLSSPTKERIEYFTEIVYTYTHNAAQTGWKMKQVEML